ncbi:MAG TPA: hypothetical protein VFD90_03990 [Gaiellales bacterium]|jgi:hypothetical protein|nr:hypothetical protein [Gaiellales bacterium]
MADVLALLRACDPAADAPAVANASAIRARATEHPRAEAAAVGRLPSKRVALVLAIGILAIGGTALADRLFTASEVFSSPDAAGQGDLRAPVHPVAGSERVVQTLVVPGVGRVKLWAADGSTRSGACLGLQFADGSWGAGKGGHTGGSGPSCFTERDDPMFSTTLIPTGIDALETNTDEPFQRIVYGIIDYDVPPTAVKLVDRVTGTSTPVIEGRWFMYVDPRADKQTDSKQLVAYDAQGRIVTGERPEGDQTPTPLGPNG